MQVLHDGKTDASEVAVTGKPDELVRLGRSLTGMVGAIVVEGDLRPDRSYAVSLRGLKVTTEGHEDPGEAVQLRIENHHLVLSGGKERISTLGESLVDFFSKRREPLGHFLWSSASRRSYLAPTTELSVTRCA